MRVQGYIELDYQAMTDEQFEQFNTIMQQYNMYYHRVAEGAREYYLCILNDAQLLPDLLELMASRNPVVNGLWDIEGTPYGKTKIVDTETGEIIISGDAEYTFNLSIHLSHTHGDPIFDSNGNISGYEIVAEFKPLHGFAGWALPTEY